MGFLNVEMGSDSCSGALCARLKEEAQQEHKTDEQTALRLWEIFVKVNG